MVRPVRLAVAGCLYFALAAFVSIVPADASTLTLRWEPNADASVGYRVSWGTYPGQPTQTVDVGQQAFFQFEAPIPPTVYYLTVTSYDTAGRESAPSAEVNTGLPAAPFHLGEVAASLASPQMAGTTIVFKAHAEGGVAPYQYKWLIFDGVEWRAVTEWSSSDTFSWHPVVAGGDYLVVAWSRDSTSSEDAPINSSAVSSTPFVVTERRAWSPAIDASAAAPQFAEATIRFTARTDTGEPRYRYKWWVFDGNAWIVAKEWSASRSFVWKPKVPNARYQVLVRVRNVDDPGDAGGAAMSFPIVPRKYVGASVAKR